MYILAVDTSALSGSAALLYNGRIISESYVNTGLTHSQTLFCLIDSCLKNAEITFEQIDYLAVCAGPGSFTGIRIGISAVKGLCFMKNLPCFPVSTLEAIASCGEIEGFIICPVMDARCSQVYNALFKRENGELKRLVPDSPKTLSELCAELRKYKDEKILLLGDGTDVTADFFRKNGIEFTLFPEIYKYQRASGVAIAAYRMYNSGVKPIDAGAVQPEYLRLSQAERERKKTEENKNDSNKQ